MFKTGSIEAAQRGRGRGRGDGRGRGRGGGNVGAGIALGIGAAVIGGAIAASAAQARQQEAINYCTQRYRSYDLQSMTYWVRTATAASVRKLRLPTRRFQNPGFAPRFLFGGRCTR